MSRSAMLGVALLLGAQGLSAAEPSRKPIRLSDGVELSRVIERQRLGPELTFSETFQFHVPKGRRGLILAEQHTADVVMTAWGSTIVGPWRIDSPLDFDGTEVLLLPAWARGHVEVEVQARLPGGIHANLEGEGEDDSASATAQSSRFTLKFETIPQTHAHRARLDLLGNLTAAGRAWAQGDGDSRQRALDFYSRAAEVSTNKLSTTQPSTDMDEPSGRLITQAAYAQAVLLRLLGRHQDARDHAQKVLDAWQRLGDRKRSADTWNEIGLVSGPAGRTDEARRAFEHAIELAEQLDDPFRLAFLRGNLCLVDLMENQLRRGVSCYAEALPTVRKIGDRETESAYLLNMAQAQRRLGELDGAQELYARALEIQSDAGLKKLEAKTLNNLAGLHLDRGDLEAALGAFQRAATAFEQLGDQRWLGRSLHNLATTYSMLGDLPSAREYLERALEVHREVGNLSGEASALKVLGHLEFLGQDLASALRAYEGSHLLEEQTHDEVGKAMVDVYIARALLDTGEPREALTRLETSIQILRRAGWNARSARVLVDLGRALAQLDRTDEARETLDEALRIFQGLDDSRGRGITLYQLAQLAESRWTASIDLKSAARHRAEALDLLQRASQSFDAVTLNLDDPDYRAFFAGSQRQVRERYITHLIELGRPTEALQVSEAARAWGLRSILATSGTPTRVGQKHEDSLVGLSAPHLKQIRAELDSDTVLLHYLVGERSSHLFVVGRTLFQTFELPSREILEKAVRKKRIGLTSTSSGATDLAPLSRMLLEPAWRLLDQPEIRRLVLALDGPLHYLPFAALPIPGTDPPPAGSGNPQLIHRFELARIPSMAVLTLERRRRSQRPPAEAFAAVFADPIFAAHDLRLPKATRSQILVPETDPLFRLRWSHREAEAVVKASHGKPILVAQGADAHRDLLLGAPLDRYKILHLATHARVDATVASRSGLELSAFDAQGSPRKAFVSLPALRRLNLQADLVVLSACRTALGPEIRGEGLVGLVQTFLEAGASRVIASLWSVPDRSTAELMEHFYTALAQGAGPSAALRRAQLQILAEHPDRHPSAWAGFVLVGDWR